MGRDVRQAVAERLAKLLTTVERVPPRQSGQGFSSFSELKRSLGLAGDGYAWHHLVGQTTANLSRFGNEAIHHSGNVVRLPHGKGSLHQAISDFYSSIQPVLSGNETVREWISKKSFDEQQYIGRLTIEVFQFERLVAIQAAAERILDQIKNQYSSGTQSAQVEQYRIEKNAQGILIIALDDRGVLVEGNQISPTLNQQDIENLQTIVERLEASYANRLQEQQSTWALAIYPILRDWVLLNRNQLRQTQPGVVRIEHPGFLYQLTFDEKNQYIALSSTARGELARFSPQGREVISASGLTENDFYNWQTVLRGISEAERQQRSRVPKLR